MRYSPALLFLSLLLGSFCTLDAAPPIDTSRGDRMIADYFRIRTEQLRDSSLSQIKTRADWEKERGKYRLQLLEMLGLDPLPKRTPLKPKITGRKSHPDFVVENLHFQSRPGLYVTGNFYRPRKVKKGQKLPTILYVCGHGRVKKNGISYGNKVHYHHHGVWFARNGYACLTIDTLQMGEIEGIHHGTYSYDMFWWLNRGYTSAGVEAWNCVRALDYLETRPEVDKSRFGVTGRSGGGAYSWWIAAIDDRIKVAVPVAGITDLENHVVDGCVEGHCDCMFMVNTYRWDYPQVAALVAPRPLLISNTDRDGIFPLDGVVRTYSKAERIYRLYGAQKNIALNITAGGHKDTQELRVHAFRWFNHYLKNDDSLVEKTATKHFQPPDLKVFDKQPSDQKNTTIQETFTKLAKPKVPLSKSVWKQLRANWTAALKAKTFRAWPDRSMPLNPQLVFSAERQGIRFAAYDFDSQTAIRLRLYVAQRKGLKNPSLVVLNVLDQAGWQEFLSTMRVAFKAELAGEPNSAPDAKGFQQTQRMFKSFPWAMAYLAPRGIGPTAWNQSKRKQTQNRRRFYLLGESLDGMRIWDTRRGIQALRKLDRWKSTQLWLQGHRRMAGVALYASLYEPNIHRLDLHELPTSHRKGPFLLNVRRILDLPQTVALVSEKTRVVLYTKEKEAWKYPQAVIQRLGWPKKNLQIRKLVK